MVFTLPANPKPYESNQKIFYNGQPIDSITEDKENKNKKLYIQNLPLFESVSVTINEILSEIVNKNFNGNMEGARWFHVGLFIMFFGIIIGILFSFLSNIHGLGLKKCVK